jgi:NhaA family Na+:H+ antiporter
VPVFALFAAGVPVSLAKLEAAITNPIGIGVVAGLVIGKLLGVFGGSWLTARLTRAELAADLRWSEIASVSLLGGVGFTVALLIGDLAFEGSPELQEVAKTGVLIGSVVAAVLAAISLRRRTRSRLAD